MTASREWLTLLRERADLTAHSIVAEIGCGEGDVGAALHTECRHWIGLEAAGATLERAQARLEGRPRVSFCEWTPPHPLDLPDGAVDIVLARIEPFDRHPGLLMEVRRVLQPGGRLIWPQPIASPQADEWRQHLLEADFERVERFDANSSSSTWIAHASSKIGWVPPARPLVHDTTHRTEGYRLLSGTGLEIGALDAPADLPTSCNVRYFDAIDTETARRLFPEADPARFVAVDFLGDLDTDGLTQFAADAFDFVVCNHVLEHVANPVQVLHELFRVVRPGGHVVVAIPDKRYTFDHERPLTPFLHVWRDYEEKAQRVTDEHYAEFIRYVVPHVLMESPANQALHLARCRQRREHAHVWDSNHFRNFLNESRRRLGIVADCRFESLGDANRIEYFGVWRKNHS